MPGLLHSLPTSVRLVLSSLRCDRFAGAARSLVLSLAVLAAPAVAHAQSPCDADLDADGVVGGADLSELLVRWGPCAGCAADINEDSLVDASDLATLLIFWGETCVQWPVVQSISPASCPRWGTT